MACYRLYLIVLSAAAAAACIPPDLVFFAPSPPNYTVVAAVSDTVLVLRYGPPDSTSAEGIQLAYDLLDRAQQIRREDLARTLRGVLNVVPEGDRVRGDKRGAQDRTILARLQRQSQARQLDLMRADAVIIRSVTADTVMVASPSSAANKQPEGQAAARWLVLVLTGEAVLDPNFGTRQDSAVRP